MKYKQTLLTRLHSLNRSFLGLYFILALLLVTLPLLAQATQATTLDTINLRAGAGRSFAVITQIPLNTTLPINGRNATSTWLLVVYNGREGWVSARYVRVDGVNISDLPESSEVFIVPTATPNPLTDDGFTRIVVTPSDEAYKVTDPDINMTEWDLSITLHWNSTANLDISVIEPNGEVLEAGSGTTRTGGALNIPNGVNNDCTDRDTAALEVANWHIKKPAPKGIYTIRVTYRNVCFAELEGDTFFWVSVKDKGPQTAFWVYSIEPNTQYEFTYVRP
jgi:uncharacterized protein YraI